MMNIIYTSLLLLGIVCKTFAIESVCSAITKTNAQIERQLQGGGFHRKLQTTVAISSSVNLNSCYVLVKEIIPSGAYCDPNELRFWEEFGGPSFFIPEFVNVEAPQHLSPKILSYFYTNPHLKENGVWYSNISIPVHIRYHRAKHGSYEALEENIVFPHPLVYIFCESEILEEACITFSQLEPCPPAGIQQCDWLPVNTFSTSDWVAAQIPVGNADLIDTVLLATTTVTFGAALLLLISIFKNTKDPYIYNRSMT